MKTPRRKQLALLGALLGAALVVVVALLAGGGSSQAPPASSPPAAASTPDTAAALERLHAGRAGEAPDLVGAPLAGRYALDYDLAMKVAAGFMGDLPPETRLQLGATLLLAPAPDADGWLVGGLTDVTVGGDPELVSRAQLGEASARLAPFAVRLDARGAIVERRYDEALPLGVRNLLAQVLTGIQLVAPEGGPAGAWEAEEEGVDGPFTARYVLRPGLVVAKTWRSEQGGEGRTLDEPAHVLTEGSVTLALLASGPLESARYRVAMTADLTLSDSAPMRVASESRATLERRGDVALSELAAIRPAGLLGADGEIAAARAGDPQRGTLPRPSGRTPEAILTASAEAQEGHDWRARKAAMRDLAATLREDPEAVFYVTERLREDDTQGDTLRTIVEALAVARTPETLGAMHKILTDATAPGTTRHSLAAVTGTMDDPPAQLVAALEDLSQQLDEVGTAALLALAMQGSRNHPGERSEELREKLLARADAAIGQGQADDEEDAAAAPPGAGAATTAGTTAPAVPAAPPSDDPAIIQAWLTALGNLGGAEVWSLVEPYLAHPDEWVRHAAVGALLDVPVLEARIAVAERVQADVSPWVRRRAVWTAGNISQSAFEDLVIRTMRSDEHPGVRLEAARVLAVWGVESPGLYEVIADAAVREPDPSTKKMMGQLQPELIGTPGVDDPTVPGSGPQVLREVTP